jgi:hypothetical protein
VITKSSSPRHLTFTESLEMSVMRYHYWSRRSIGFLPLGGYAGGGHRRVRRIIGAVLIVLLLMGMAGLGAWQLLGGSGGAVLSRDASPIGRGASTRTDLTPVRGVVGSEKKAFFSDPEVERIFAENGLAVEVDTAGSREIATSTDLKSYDFASPSSAPAGEKIKREHKTLGCTRRSTLR